MVKARGDNKYIDSDYSIAIQYVKNENNEDSDSGIKFIFPKERYIPVKAPLINELPPLMESSTDYTNNYYLVDGGYITNVPISTGISAKYNGQTPLTVSYEKSEATEEEVKTIISNTVTESVSQTKMNQIIGKVAYETGEIPKLLGSKFSAEIGYTREWGTVTERVVSTTNISSVTNRKEETEKNTIQYFVGNNNEKPGSYRISIFTSCDIIYLVTTDRKNTKLIEFKIILSPRAGVEFALEYDEDGRFQTTAEENLIDWPDQFFLNYPIPTQTLSRDIKFDVDGGYALDKDNMTITLGIDYVFPIPKRYNYTFGGWFSESDGQGTRYTDHKGVPINKWIIEENVVLYAYWVKSTTQVNISTMELKSQEIYSTKSSIFSIDLDINTLKSIGYNYLNISITGTCSGYEYKMNERGRYFLLIDVLSGNIESWTFKVKGFGGVEGKNISLDRLNDNAQYQLQLISDKSDAYDEKLVVSNVVINITAVK